MNIPSSQTPPRVAHPAAPPQAPADHPAGRVAAAEVEIVAPHFKKRLSGVTSTVIQLLPLQAKRHRIKALGPGLPDHLDKLRLSELPALWRRPKNRPFRIWHARRNVEMFPGILLRDVLRMPLRLVFTSAAQRRHTAYTKWLIGRMDAVIATSTKAASYLDVPATVIMHGVDLERFRPAPDKPALLRSLGFDDGVRLVGCFGRVRHQKGTDLFVEAMIDLLPRHPSWTAVITGRTTAENQGFEADMKAKVAAAGLSGRILFLGEQPDITVWFRALSLFVAPQRWEGFGLTPLEAMASGVPVVATDVGAFSDLIVEGDTGTVVPPEDLRALTAAADRFMGDPEALERSSRAGLAHVRSNFALSREVEEIGRVYENLWAGRPQS